MYPPREKLEHWAKITLLGIGMTCLDVAWIGLNGKQYLETKNISRQFDVNTSIPDACKPLNDSTTEYLCQETDLKWGILTLFCIQLPSIVMSICAAAGLTVGYFKYKDNPDIAYKVTKKYFLGILAFVFVPYPIVVLGHQVRHLCRRDAKMEMQSAILLFGEGALEASPQLLLQIYIILSDAEREVTTFQWLAITSAFLIIAKTSIELYASESGYWQDFQEFVKHERTFDDSMMKDKRLKAKLFIMIKISLPFLTSLMFKVGSLAIICTMLKAYSAIYLSVGIILAFIISYKAIETEKVTDDERLGVSLFYALCNITIVSKCPMYNRKGNFKPMMGVSIMWLIFHSMAMILLMIWYGALPTSYHLAHWPSTHVSSKAFFYPFCNILLFIIGPLSILALWTLRRQVKAMETDPRMWNAKLKE